MRILTSLSLTIFYCLFVSNGQATVTSLTKLEKADANSIYKVLNGSNKKVSKDEDPILSDHISERKLDLLPLYTAEKFSSFIVPLHHPRALRIKSSLSPPV